MADEPKASVTDIAGLQPLSKAAEILAQGTVDGAAAFFGKLCMPAVKEVGLWAKDKVHDWRTGNLVKLAQKAEAKMKTNELQDGLHANPRLLHTIMDQASWVDDSVVQDLWAGLLSSSCTKDGDDDSNLMFTNLLSNLTKLQARLLKAACEMSSKQIHGGFVNANILALSIDEVKETTGEGDVHRLDRELDHLRSLSLIDQTSGGIWAGAPNVVYLTPTPLALHMYVRCQGSRKSLAEFFSETQ